MGAKNILNIKTRAAFRKWLEENNHKESECWMVAKKGKTPPLDCVWYLDAVEEALCFGWIDTTQWCRYAAVYASYCEKLLVRVE